MLPSHSQSTKLAERGGVRRRDPIAREHALGLGGLGRGRGRLRLGCAAERRQHRQREQPADRPAPGDGARQHPRQVKFEMRHVIGIVP
jgi:hypothetical protein